MTEQTYSHATIWFLVHSLPLMEYTHRQEPKMWRKFIEAVSNETAQGYPDTWNTNYLINKMADDLGSYDLLLRLWMQIEEALDDIINPIYFDHATHQQ